jgi:hypothetical protein
VAFDTLAVDGCEKNFDLFPWWVDVPCSCYQQNWSVNQWPLSPSRGLTYGCIGGAYVGPARKAHFEVLLDRIKEHQHSSNQSVSDLAVLVVAYTLAPKGIYPLQLRQAASALNYVLHIKDVSPSQVSPQLQIRKKRPI